MKPENPSMAEIETAEAGSTRCRWKKRMSRASRPAVQGIARAMKPMANCSMARGP